MLVYPMKVVPQLSTQETCTWTFTAALFIIARLAITQVAIVRRMNKMIHLYDIPAMTAAISMGIRNEWKKSRAEDYIYGIYFKKIKYKMAKQCIFSVTCTHVAMCSSTWKKQRKNKINIKFRIVVTSSEIEYNRGTEHIGRFSDTTML